MVPVYNVRQGYGARGIRPGGAGIPSDWSGSTDDLVFAAEKLVEKKEKVAKEAGPSNRAPTNRPLPSRHTLAARVTRADGKPCTWKTTDIGDDGFFVGGTPVEPVGTELDLKVWLPGRSDKADLDCRARVVKSIGKGDAGQGETGVMDWTIVDIVVEERRALRRFLRQWAVTSAEISVADIRPEKELEAVAAPEAAASKPNEPHKEPKAPAVARQVETVVTPPPSMADDWLGQTDEHVREPPEEAGDDAAENDDSAEAQQRPPAPSDDPRDPDSRLPETKVTPPPTGESPPDPRLTGEREWHTGGSSPAPAAREAGEDGPVGDTASSFEDMYIHRQPDDLEPVQKIGKYEIIAPIGRGGMGVVYLVRHEQLGRKFALKRIDTGVAANAGMVRRFFEEARRISQLEHPHIVQVTDFIEEEDHTCFVMELVRGISIGERLNKEAFRAKEVLAIGIQLCDVLQVVHDAGIIHRDLKPANVLLTEHGGRKDFVKLLDFGIAKFADPETGDGRGVTKAGTSLGTPGYASPEQLMGLSCDPRADIYALGVIMYEMLTKRRAFTAATLPELIRFQTTGAPPRPSRFAESRVPTALEDLVLQCLHGDPASRPQNADAVREQLETIQQLETLSPHPQMQSADKPKRRTGRVLFLLAIAGAAAAAGRFFPDEVERSMTPLLEKAVVVWQKAEREWLPAITGNDPGPETSTGQETSPEATTDAPQPAGPHPLAPEETGAETADEEPGKNPPAGKKRKRRWPRGKSGRRK